MGCNHLSIPYFNICTVIFWEWINSFIPHLLGIGLLVHAQIKVTDVIIRGPGFFPYIARWHYSMCNSHTGVWFKIIVQMPLHNASGFLPKISCQLCFHEDIFQILLYNSISYLISPLISRDIIHNHVHMAIIFVLCVIEQKWPSDVIWQHQSGST